MIVVVIVTIIIIPSLSQSMLTDRNFEIIPVDTDIDSVNRDNYNIKKKLLQTVPFTDFGDINDIVTTIINNAGNYVMNENLLVISDTFSVNGTKFFIKASSHVDEKMVLVNEGFIYVYALNSYAHNPKCYRVGFDQVITINNKSYVYNFLIIDYIEGVNLARYIHETPDVNKLKQLLNTVIKILKEYYDKVEFTHYDLNLGNIIVAKDKPVLIDFGTSHIKVGGNNYGDIIEIGNVYNRSYWITDVVRLLLTMYGELNINSNINKIIHDLPAVDNLKDKISQAVSQISTELDFRDLNKKFKMHAFVKVMNIITHSDYYYEASQLLAKYLQYFFDNFGYQSFINITNINSFYTLNYQESLQRLSFADFISYIETI